MLGEGGGSQAIDGRRCMAYHDDDEVLLTMSAGVGTLCAVLQPLKPPSFILDTRYHWRWSGTATPTPIW